MSDWTDNERHGRGDDHGEYRHALDLDRPVELTVNNPNGEVTIRATDRPDAVIRHVKRGHPGSRQYEDADLIIETRDNRIAVRAELGNGVRWAGVSVDININPFKRGSGRGIEIATSNGDIRYDLEIELPHRVADSRVEVKTASGAVDVAALAGAITLATASGDVHARETRGGLTIQTASGDLTLERVRGALTARTASGDARLHGAALDTFSLQSVSGDLDLDAILTGSGDYRLQTVSGDVRLALAVPPPTAGGEPGAALAFESVSGDARVEPPFQATGRRAWRSGAGTPAVRVKTVSGDLTASLAVREVPPALAVRATTAFTPPDPPNPPASPPAAEPIAMPAPAVASPVPGGETAPDEATASDEEQAEQAARLDVLAAVERGEIDVEEALRRLEGTETPVER